MIDSSPEAQLAAQRPDSHHAHALEQERDTEGPQDGRQERCVEHVTEHRRQHPHHDEARHADGKTGAGRCADVVLGQFGFLHHADASPVRAKTCTNSQTIWASAMIPKAAGSSNREIVTV